ncbi:MAG: A/G-specific adenine glycosylase [Phycisphaerae bacterium]|nr:A/G-specific adenine glycosylase [Phycisphaerae bacterium]
MARWFAGAARPLAWRTTPRDAYRSLVSEVMLQQTQVSRVLEKFDGFVARFPTAAALARADEGEVLAAWSGLGYYRRARLLHAAARAIVQRHAGEVPRSVEALCELPGVGRYTAGAIASIVFGRDAPIVDGNVARVLLRISARPLATDKAMGWAWKKAERLATLAHGRGVVGGFNEGLMELGATICTPASPRCGSCPVARLCAARAKGTQGSIPRPKARAAVRAMVCEVVVVVDRLGRLLVERRGAGGMWGGLWQAPTHEHEGGAAARNLSTLMALQGVRVGRVAMEFEHATTHRRVVFRVRRARAARPESLLALGRERRWATREEIAGLGLSSAQRRILLGDG